MTDVNINLIHCNLRREMMASKIPTTFASDDVRAYILEMLAGMAELARACGEERLAADLDKMAQRVAWSGPTKPGRQEIEKTKLN